MITVHSSAGAALLRQCFLCVWVCVHASDHFKPRFFPDPLHLGLFFHFVQDDYFVWLSSPGTSAIYKGGALLCFIENCCLLLSALKQNIKRMYVYDYLLIPAGHFESCSLLNSPCKQKMISTSLTFHTPHPLFSLSLISHIVSVYVKHHVYLRMIMCIHCTQGDCGIKQHRRPRRKKRKKARGDAWKCMLKEKIRAVSFYCACG